MNPTNLEEAIDYLIKHLQSTEGAIDESKYWASLKEEDAVNGVHFTAGMNLRNKLELWHENDLTKWFNSIGIVHPDDMSGIIFTSTYRRLNKKYIELDKQIKVYQNHWKKFGFADGIPTKGE